MLPPQPRWGGGSLAAPWVSRRPGSVQSTLSLVTSLSHLTGWLEGSHLSNRTCRGKLKLAWLTLAARGSHGTARHSPKQREAAGETMETIVSIPASATLATTGGLSLVGTSRPLWSCTIFLNLNHVLADLQKMSRLIKVLVWSLPTFNYQTWKHFSIRVPHTARSLQSVPDSVASMVLCCSIVFGHRGDERWQDRYITNKDIPSWHGMMYRTRLTRGLLWSHPQPLCVGVEVKSYATQGRLTWSQTVRGKLTNTGY